MKRSLCFIACLSVGACQLELEPQDEPALSSTSQAATMLQSELDNAYTQASNSSHDRFGGKMSGQVNGRHVAWKSNPWSSSSSGQNAVCTYGWCGGLSIGDCSKKSGDSREGYSFGACNSTAWGERFAGFLWNSAAKANYKTRVSGTTTFGYHPYWCFRYGDGSVRTYHGWSYSNHCGSKVSFEVAPAPPPPAQCGNGVVEAGEQCDLGETNGTFGTCCSRECKFQSSGTVCRDALDACDAAEVCSGSSASCPSDALASSGSQNCSSDSDCNSLGANYKCLALTSSTKKCWQQCRGDVGTCDLSEFCHAARDSWGSWTSVPAPHCPQDLIKSVGSSCNYGGLPGTCSAAGVCDTQPIPSGWICEDSWWGDGKCDCGCGAYDNDCNAAPTPVFQNCPGGETCNKDQTVCVASGVPAGWTCAASRIGDGFCDCGCGAPDPDCDKLATRLRENCGSGYSCSWAESRCHNNTSSYYIYKNGSSRLGACPASWARDSICDIGCQFRDARCGGPW